MILVAIRITPPFIFSRYFMENNDNSYSVIVLTPAYNQLVILGSFPMVKEMKHEAHYSLPSCVVVKNKQSFTYIIPR
jgi:hypothetical protein